MDPVDAVRLVSFQEVDQVAGAADACHHHVILHGLAGLFRPVDHGHLKGASDAEIATARAPFEIVFRVLLAHTLVVSFS